MYDIVYYTGTSLALQVLWNSIMSTYKNGVTNWNVEMKNLSNVHELVDHIDSIPF